MWRNRDSEQPVGEPPAEDVHQSDSTAEAVPGSGPSAAEPTPAFRRAQGQRLGTTEPAQAAAEPAEAPAVRSPAGTDAPAPVLGEDVVVIDAETAVKNPALTATPRDPSATEMAHKSAAGGEALSAAGGEALPAAGEGSPAAEVPPTAVAPAAAAGPHGGIAPQRWSEILVSFVDDPRGSVKMAADTVDSAIEEIVTLLRARQQALASSWQDSGADTEQLRTALREYRKFGAQIHRMSPAELGGQGTADAD